MDGDRNPRFVKTIGQKETANFLFYRYGKLVGRYNGGSSTDEVTRFAMSKTGIPFVTFDDYTIAQDFIESNDGAVVLYLPRAGGPLFEKYGVWAEHLRDNTSFGLCPDPDIAEELDIFDLPSLVLYRHTDQLKAVYVDDLNEATLDDIVQWVNYNRKPMFETFKVDKQNIYKGGKPVLLFFLPVEEHSREEAIIVVQTIAQTYGSDFRVEAIDAVTGNRFMTDIGFGRYADPAVAILVYSKLGKLTKYLHGEEDPFTEEHIGKFIEDFFEKKLEPNIRNANLPEPNDAPVSEVNALTFNDTVINSNDDVIVLYYEEWDQIYQDFLPQLTEIAEKFENSTKSKISFVKFNVATNDILVGPDPKTTPSIYLFARGLKRKPIFCDKRLNKKGVTEFIYEELSIKIDEL